MKKWSSEVAGSTEDKYIREGIKQPLLSKNAQ